MRAKTTIEKVTDVLVRHIKECDGDELLSIFDYSFGTNSGYNKRGQLIIKPGKEDEYGGIIEEEFKEEIIK